MSARGPFDSAPAPRSFDSAPAPRALRSGCTERKSDRGSAGRGPIFLAAGLAALVLGVGLLLFGRKSERGAFAEKLSTFRASPDGAKALARLCERLGARVERRTERLIALEGVDLLFVLEPQATRARGPFLATVGVDKDEAAAVERWVKAGGTLVVAATEETELHEKFGVTVGPARAAVGEVGPAVPSAFADGVERLATASAPLGLTALREEAIPILRRGDSIFGLAIRVGSGKAVFLADPAVLSNRFLAAADNAVLAGNLLAAARPRGRVAFDEVHHGFAGDRGVMGYVGRRSLAPLLVQACGAILSFAAAVGGRRGRAPLVEEERPPESRESVRAMAEIYGRARLRAYCAKALEQALVREVEAATGVEGQGRGEALHSPPAGEGAEPLPEILRRHGVRSFRALDGIGRRARQIEAREARGGASEHELLVFAREVGRFEAEVREAFGRGRR